MFKFSTGSAVVQLYVSVRMYSSSQELHPDEIDTDSAYILFYEQQGVDYAQFLPKIDGKKMADTSSMDEDFESDYKKYCVLQ